MIPSMPHILTINTGSSSLKFGLYDAGPDETLALCGVAQRIGASGGSLHIEDSDGAALLDHTSDFRDHGAALETAMDWLRRSHSSLDICAIGHRVVHGGAGYSIPTRITPELIADLVELTPLAPDHLPQAIQAIQVAGKAYPDVPQAACFDTAFHKNMPWLAHLYPLPRKYYSGNQNSRIIRYGFHGLSYEWIMSDLENVAPDESGRRVIIAHLGNGCSMAAVRDGASVDTTMGFTPAGGLMMGARPGDLDPGVLLYLLAQKKMTPEAMDRMINQQCGLLGVSGTSADMRDLLKKERADRDAADAVALFCYQAKKYLGALTTVLNGLDTLVFTGGIGEHAAPVRQRICEGLEYLGIGLDPARNEAHAPIISDDGSRVTVRIIKTDEDRMIARHTREVLGRRMGEWVSG